MARVKTAKVIGKLDREITEALARALKKVDPDGVVDVKKLKKEFLRHLDQRIPSRVSIPDVYVDV